MTAMQAPGDLAAGHAPAVDRLAHGHPAADDPAAGDPGDPAGVPAPPGPPELREDDLPGALEAVLLVVDAPVPVAALATATGHPVARVAAALAALAERYTATRSGIDLRRVGDGWRLFTRDVYAPVVEKFVVDGQQARLSRAALETLAVIAYRQPVTRARIAAVRGVNADGVVRTLAARGLIAEAGIDPETGGAQFVTTGFFLDRLGIDGLDELPSLGPLLPDVDGIDE